MLETVKFPLGTCPSCGPNMLLAQDLDEHDALVTVCAHCGTRIPDDLPRRELGAASLTHYGYVVEGELEERGCGTSSGGGGGCGSCGIH